MSRVKRSQPKPRKYVIVVGCGRVGAQLANLLDEDGDAVVVVDSSADSFKRLHPGFGGSTMVGDAKSTRLLERAGIRNADALVTATQGDNTNIMIAQMAQKIYQVRNVVARCYDPVRSDAYAALGLRTICPTTVGAEMLRDALQEVGSGA